MKKRITIYTRLLFAVVAILSLLYINIKTPFAEMMKIYKPHQLFKNLDEYKEEINGLIFPEDKLNFRLYENQIIYGEDKNIEMAYASFKRGNEYITVDNGFFTEDSNLEVSLFYGLISGRGFGPREKYLEKIDFTLDGFDKVSLFKDKRCNEYYFFAANKINDLEYSAVRIISIDMNFDDVEKVIRSIKEI